MISRQIALRDVNHGFASFDINTCLVFSSARQQGQCTAVQSSQLPWSQVEIVRTQHFS